MKQVRIVDCQSENAAKDFALSLRETGFAVVKNHGVPFELVQAVYDEWLAFFKTEAKHQYLFDREKQDGYFPPEVSETAKGHTEKDIKEYYHIYSWGRYPEGLSNKAHELCQRSTELAVTLLNWLEGETPAEIREKLSESFASMIENSDNVLQRILHYPPMTGSEEPGAIRAAAHGDINLLTVLPSSNEPGLQVKPIGSDWLDVPCEPETIVINAGDMLEEATAGYYPSTLHRVINPTGERSANSRLTAPLFLHPRSEVVLSERHTAKSYLDERLKELGVK
ncbi:2OG-Fe(II) oxygenase family protein [Piscirickettsia litoralis]|uniref:2-oxoglutarate-dependent ethylene/succinate-forming enzyme n=1 Tax=Piscirickettsia litoralis TaxID=1891921 RepID=A0ABX3A5L1_9GAMM|nr:2OG-Fe(II) oxygenase family protein [Piscirickettsia litoralis]ODN43507.1 2OG-Fe(II) oxygenase [Piscirickettsia litoralis]